MLAPIRPSASALDGVYVIRTSLQEKDLSAADQMHTNAALTRIERPFQTLQTVDLQVRPIHYRPALLVRAHRFPCRLAYFVESRMRGAQRPLLADIKLEEGRATHAEIRSQRRSRPPPHTGRRSRARPRTAHRRAVSGRC